MNVGHLPDDTLIKTLGSGIVCTQCGHLGANVVPELADPFRAALILIIRPFCSTFATQGYLKAKSRQRFRAPRRQADCNN